MADEDTPPPLSLSAGDPDGDNLTWGWDVLPADGSLSGSGLSFTYTPQQDYYGSDFFQFHVTDGVAPTGTYQVDITVNPVNDDPVCRNVLVNTERDAC